LEPVLSGTL
jgi:hypothetical protein